MTVVIRLKLAPAIHSLFLLYCQAVIHIPLSLDTPEIVPSLLTCNILVANIAGFSTGSS